MTDPAAIDLDDLPFCIGILLPSGDLATHEGGRKVLQEAGCELMDIAEVEALRERVAKLEEKLARSEYWEGKLRQVAGHDIHEVFDRAEATEARAVKLAGVLGKMMAGIHAMRDGDVPPLDMWQELWDEALDALDLPAKQDVP